MVHLIISGTKIDTTEKHPFWVIGKGWVNAADLKSGNKVSLKTGEIGNVDSVEVEELDEPVKVYNFEVEDWHTYFVSDIGVLVHNKCWVDAKTVSNPAESSGRQLWTNKVEHNGTKVYQRDDIINSNKVDKMGRTNIERMEQGLAPLGSDGKSVNLHHMTQTNDSAIAEVTQTFHQQNKKAIHINPNTIPSGIDRNMFNRWRKSYWKNRANDFK